MPSFSVITLQIRQELIPWWIICTFCRNSWNTYVWFALCVSLRPVGLHDGLLADVRPARRVQLQPWHGRVPWGECRLVHVLECSLGWCLVGQVMLLKWRCIVRTLIVGYIFICDEVRSGNDVQRILGPEITVRFRKYLTELEFTSGIISYC